MFRRWFSRAELPFAAVPDGLAIYAIGDIHGRLDLITELLTKIADDAGRHPDDCKRRLIFLATISTEACKVVVSSKPC